MESNPEFLKEKYGLHNAPEVEAAAEHTKKITGEKILQNLATRIQNHLNHLEHLGIRLK